MPGILLAALHSVDDHPIAERDRLNAITQAIIGAAIRVHEEIGAGALESACEACLVFELNERGLEVQRQVAVPLIYRGRRLDGGYRIDILVERCVIVEVKSVDRIAPVHRAQVLSYLRVRKLKVGLLINFNVPKLLSGVTRIVNGFPD